MARKGTASPNSPPSDDLVAIMDAEVRLAQFLAEAEGNARILVARAEARVQEMEREEAERLAKHLARVDLEESVFRSAELNRIAQDLAAESARWREVAATGVPDLVDIVLTRLIEPNGKDGAR